MITLDWLGCATFRLVIGDLVIFLDAYIDRVATAPPVGIATRDIDRADYILVGHSHFDHLGGAEVIAARTGARIIGSNESCRVMRECGVPGSQLINSQGGERHQLADGVAVRVFPSLHACIWASGRGGIGDEHTGDLGLTETERRGMMTARGGFMGEAVRRDPERARLMQEHVASATGSGRDGGPLAFLIETPAGSIYYHDTSGCWSGVLRDLRADVAILALSGRPNLDGDPYQGSLAQFVAMEASWLQPKTVVFGHHDNWGGMMDQDVLDISPARDALRAAVPGATLLEPWYREGTRLLEA
jgi:L-ascorbate metabolism protein UlaG (beta-lactamase superfamily)